MAVYADANRETFLCINKRQSCAKLSFKNGGCVYVENY